MHPVPGHGLSCRNKQCTGQRPVGVLYPHTAAAVAGAVQCARARGVRVVPRSGGGSFACYAERNGTLTLSLEEMAWVRVGGPRHAPTVTVGGGTRLGALYYHVNRLAGSSWSVVAGTCPSVGVGGHILGARAAGWRGRVLRGRGHVWRRRHAAAAAAAGWRSELLRVAHSALCVGGTS